MIRFKLVQRIMLALIAALAASSIGWSQATGSLVGTVQDSAGAVIPGAKITITDLATNQSQTAQSDGNGNFRFVQLLPGYYKVSVEKTNFETFLVPSEQVATGIASKVSVAMKVGAQSQTVEVTTQAPLLQTQSSSLSYGVEQRQVSALPLNGRNVLNMEELVPGVVPQGGTVNKGDPGNTSGNYQIGGGTANQSATYVDGAPVNYSYVNGQTGIPTQDDVQEFNIMTNNVTPEYGRFAGGIVSIATKSGTNEFHGALYDYIRNAAFNANSWFNNNKGLPRPVYTQNQYGAAVGGPIRKDKDFFFLNWEGFGTYQAGTVTTSVPTPQMLQGDFSQLLSQAKPLQLYQPGTTCGSTRCKFTGNNLAGSLNPAAQTLAPLLWPKATDPTKIANNFNAETPSYNVQNTWIARGDEQLGTRQKLFERYENIHTNYQLSPRFGPGSGVQEGNGSIHQGHSAILGDTITINQSTVADLRLSYLRNTSDSLPWTCCKFNEGSIAPAWAKYNQGMTFPELPEPNVTSEFNFNPIPTILEKDNAYILSGNVTKILGRHTLSFGGELRKIEWGYVQSNFSGMTWNMSGDYTRVTNTAKAAPANGGFGFADFMLGDADYGVAAEPALSKGEMWYSGLFVNDSFRWSPKLTINAGVRWEQPGSFSESHGSLTTMVLNLPQASLTTAANANGYSGTLTGGLALTNSSQYPHSTWQELHWDLFSPRVGFAYNPTSSIVISAGYGIAYLPPTVDFALGPYNDPLNNAVTLMDATDNGSSTPTNTLTDPFPNGIQPPPGRSQTYINSLVGQGIQSPLPQASYPYEQQWNLTFEKQLGNSSMVQIGYVGAHGSHLPIYSVNMDQLPDQYNICGTDNTQPQCGGHFLMDKVSNPFYGIISPKAGTLGQQQVPYGYLLKPHPQYVYMTNDAATYGETSYEALEVMARKQYSSGGMVQAAYTFSNFFGTADVLDAWTEANRFGVGGSYGVQDNTNINGNASNPGEYSRSSFQTPHRLVVAYLYPLPFGHGARFLSGVSPAVDKLVGGWAVNGISTFMSGFPLAMEDANQNQLENLFAQGFSGPGTGAGVTRPNFTPGCKPNIGGAPSARLHEWFNTSCFSAPTAWEYGNEPRVDPNLRAQGMDSSDFSITKAITFHERYAFHATIEAYNVFNWTQFSPPNEQADSTTFGIVNAQYNQPRIMQFSGRFTF